MEQRIDNLRDKTAALCDKVEIGKLYNHDPNHYRFKRQLERYDGLKPKRRSRLIDALLLALVVACLFVIML